MIASSSMIVLVGEARDQGLGRGGRVHPLAAGGGGDSGASRSPCAFLAAASRASASGQWPVVSRVRARIVGPMPPWSAISAG